LVAGKSILLLTGIDVCLLPFRVAPPFTAGGFALRMLSLYETLSRSSSDLPVQGGRRNITKKHATHFPLWRVELDDRAKHTLAYMQGIFINLRLHVQVTLILVVRASFQRAESKTPSGGRLSVNAKSWSL